MQTRWLHGAGAGLRAATCGSAAGCVGTCSSTQSRTQRACTSHMRTSHMHALLHPLTRAWARARTDIRTCMGTYACPTPFLVPTEGTLGTLPPRAPAITLFHPQLQTRCPDMRQTTDPPPSPPPQPPTTHTHSPPRTAAPQEGRIQPAIGSVGGQVEGQGSHAPPSPKSKVHQLQYTRACDAFQAWIWSDQGGGEARRGFCERIRLM